MKKRRFVYALVLLSLLVGSYFLIFGRSTADSKGYEFGNVVRGTIENTVSATGTITPVTTVDVGTQVSGTIDSVYVDYNQSVKAGQILAVLDTTLLRSTVLDAEANLSKTEAQLMQAQSDFDRSKSLHDRNLIPESDFLTAKVNLKVQQAAVKSSRAALSRARRNLDLAVIRSPITGIVISRNIDAGQTVAASLSSPTLFIIAENLRRMEVLADVDESDIGLIKSGQDVHFQVTAYQDKTFSGTVKQIRLQPKTISNVVTYTVVVEAANDEGLLLPGMTATLDFVTDRRTNALLVPSKALRFEPSPEELAKFESRNKAKEQPGKPAGGGHGGALAQDGTPHGQFGGNGHLGGSADFAAVWYIDSLGQLAEAPFKTGLSDGHNTEIARSRVLTDGMKVIVGDEDTSSPGSSAQSGGSRRMRMHGPFGF